MALRAITYRDQVQKEKGKRDLPGLFELKLSNGKKNIHSNFQGLGPITAE